MLKITGFVAERSVTPVPGDDGNIIDLVPGRVRNYVCCQMWGRSFRVRVPFWVIQLAF